MQHAPPGLGHVVTLLLSAGIALAVTRVAERRGLATRRDGDVTRSHWGRTIDHDKVPSYDRPSTAFVFLACWCLLSVLFSIVLIVVFG